MNACGVLGCEHYHPNHSVSYHGIELTVQEEAKYHAEPSSESGLYWELPIGSERKRMLEEINAEMSRVERMHSRTFVSPV